LKNWISSQANLWRESSLIHESSSLLEVTSVSSPRISTTLKLLLIMVKTEKQLWLHYLIFFMISVSIIILLNLTQEFLEFENKSSTIKRVNPFRFWFTRLLLFVFVNLDLSQSWFPGFLIPKMLTVWNQINALKLEQIRLTGYNFHQFPTVIVSPNSFVINLYCLKPNWPIQCFTSDQII
jgi:hypothetical protein